MKRALVYYAAQALLVAAVLVVTQRLLTKDLHVPFDARGDALFWTVLTEATYEDGLFGTVHRLGAPFGTDMVDWNPAIPFDFTALRLLRSLAGSAGLAVNLYWLLSIVATGVTATYAFRVLSLRPALAFALGTSYALLPYGLGQSVGHLVLVFHFVPLIAALCVRIAAGTAGELGRTPKAVLWGACALQGLSYVYYSFFSCVLLGSAGVIGWAKTRRAESLRHAAVAVALIVVCLALSLAPSFWYWHEHGKTSALVYKTPAMAELYGLKIRHLLTPNPGHPLAAFRRLSETLNAAAAPPDQENGLSRLGLLGALGFLGLLAVAVLGAVRDPAVSEELRAAAALNIVALLWALSGGFGALWSALVVPDIRAYCRLVVFIAFFSLLATGAALAWAHDALTRRGVRVPGAPAALALCLLAAFDQAWTGDRTAENRQHEARFAADRDFVRRVEAALPAGGMVFQLPVTRFPVETGTGRMVTYDHGRGYLHSRALRWSWGALSGRNDDWAEVVEKLPPAELVRFLAEEGFSAVWIDRWGYLGHKHGADPTADVAEAAERTPLVDGDDRVAVVRLDRVRAATSSGEPGSEAEARRRLVPPLVHVADGCEPEGAAKGWPQFRCGARASLVVRNHAKVAREVELVLTVEPVGSVPLGEIRLAARGEGRAYVAPAAGSHAVRYSLGPDDRRSVEVSVGMPFRLTRLVARDVGGEGRPGGS